MNINTIAVVGLSWGDKISEKQVLPYMKAKANLSTT